MCDYGGTTYHAGTRIRDANTYTALAASEPPSLIVYAKQQQPGTRVLFASYLVRVSRMNRLLF